MGSRCEISGIADSEPDVLLLARAELDVLSERYGPNHPKLQRLAERIALLEQGGAVRR